MTPAQVIKQIRVLGLEHESSARTAAERGNHSRAAWHLLNAVAANRGRLIGGKSGDPRIDPTLATAAHSYGLVVTAESLEEVSHSYD